MPEQHGNISEYNNTCCDPSTNQKDKVLSFHPKYTCLGMSQNQIIFLHLENCGGNPHLKVKKKVNEKHIYLGFWFTWYINDLAAAWCMHTIRYTLFVFCILRAYIVMVTKRMGKKYFDSLTFRKIYLIVDRYLLFHYSHTQRGLHTVYSCSSLLLDQSLLYPHLLFSHSCCWLSLWEVWWDQPISHFRPCASLISLLLPFQIDIRTRKYILHRWVRRDRLISAQVTTSSRRHRLVLDVVTCAEMRPSRLSIFHKISCFPLLLENKKLNTHLL